MNQIKQILALALCSLLMFKVMLVPALFVNYELRKDFIIKNYCVNKDRPELHCDGKCYLAQQIKKAEQQDERQATDSFITKILKTEIQQNRAEFCPIALISYLPTINNFTEATLITQLFGFSIYHPPQV